MSRNEAITDGNLDEDGKGKPSRKTYESKRRWPSHYNPKPGELDAVWPTVRTNTFVEMVFGVIKERHQCTQREIVDVTELPKDTVGVALADLMLWQEKIGSELRELGRGEERIYFVK